MFATRQEDQACVIQRRDLTKQDVIKAWISEELIDNETIHVSEAATYKPDQVLVLASANHIYFIMNLFSCLISWYMQTFYSDLSAIRQSSLS